MATLRRFGVAAALTALALGPAAAQAAGATLTVRAAVAANCLLSPTRVAFEPIHRGGKVNGEDQPGAAAGAAGPPPQQAQALVDYACTDGSPARIGLRDQAMVLTGVRDPAHHIIVTVAPAFVVGDGALADARIALSTVVTAATPNDVYRGRAPLQIEPDRFPTGAQVAEIEVSADVEPGQ
jgi:hypothetical protein